MIGAGALGAVYGAFLARVADVVFVVRPQRAASTEPIVIERVRGGARLEIAAERTSAVPGDADIVLVAVGTEDLDALPLGSSSAPLVFLTPMLTHGWERVRARLGERAFAGLPGVIAYVRDDGVTRYWLPPTATKIDEPRSEAHRTVVRELAASLDRAGLRARLELGVHEANPATTVSFITLGMAIAIAGSVGALAESEELLALARRATSEGVRLAPRLGRAEAWSAFAPVLATPWAFRAFAATLARLSPEGLGYADEHFGRKLIAQHRSMAAEMVVLCRERGLPAEAIGEVAAKLALLEGG